MQCEWIECEWQWDLQRVRCKWTTKTTSTKINQEKPQDYKIVTEQKQEHYTNFVKRNKRRKKLLEYKTQFRELKVANTKIHTNTQTLTQIH